jgi:DNA-directed RNA polymerase specialized sigma24 family protein
MPVEKKGSVTCALDDLKAGENRGPATEKVWEHAFHKLLPIARRMLRDTPRTGGDEEDVAISALQSLCEGAAHGDFPDLTSRDNLWRVLYTITVRKAIAQKTHELALKRGAGRIVDADLLAVADQAPTPEFAASMVDELRFRLNLLRDDTLRQVALLLLEGSSNDEIATRLQCSARTVERKRSLIRKAWEREQPS